MTTETKQDTAYDRLMFGMPANSSVLVEGEDRQFDSPGGGSRILPMVQITVVWDAEGVRYVCKGEGQTKVIAAERVLAQMERMR